MTLCDLARILGLHPNNLRAESVRLGVDDTTISKLAQGRLSAADGLNCCNGCSPRYPGIGGAS